MWVIASAPHPGIETFLPEYCTSATDLGMQHCHLIACSTARDKQSYPVPRSAAQGHSKPYLGSQPVKQASVFRKVTSVSVICVILGLTQGLWVSLFPIPMKYVGSRQKLCFWFCTPRPCNVQLSSTRPYLCNCSEGKGCYLGHNMEHRQMKSFCILIKLSWRGKKR